ncbi:hypothetical protein BDV26DRAFT_304775 [Aspergillus bertholletiae]|uniref:Uncharacterized protein n=1 Tax=Aspergillus bertholletiae TaxID=1226010 RepID=A0A5N7B7Q0_9EURO|nr:hypothetical protein BDV26DRAFT_304775 [Aspergillus bertholletiae]
MYCYQCCHLSQQPHNGYPEALFRYGLEHLELCTTYLSQEPAQGLNPYYTPNAFEMCQAAIDVALILNRENDLNAASMLLTIDGHSLWEAQRQQFPEPVNIQEYNQRTTTENGSISFWRELNHCWLKLGRNISETLRQKTHIDCNAKESLEEWLKELVDHVINVSDFLEDFGLVDYERGIWEDDIVSCFEGCFEALEQIGTTPFNSQGSYNGAGAQMTQQ